MADSRLNLSRAGSVIMGAKRNDDGGFLGQPMKELEQAEDDFAQQALVEAVENQIADGHPREAGLVIMDLIGQGVDRDDALVKMADVLAAQIAQSMQEDRPFDVNAYARDLLQLGPFRPVRTGNRGRTGESGRKPRRGTGNYLIAG